MITGRTVPLRENADTTKHVSAPPATYSDPLGLLVPNDCYSTAPCTITVSGGESGLTPAEELLIDGVEVVPNIMLHPPLPQPNSGPLPQQPSSPQPMPQQVRCNRAMEAAKALGVAAAVSVLGAVVTSELPPLGAMYGSIAFWEGLGSGTLAVYAVYVCSQ